MRSTGACEVDERACPFVDRELVRWDGPTPGPLAEPHPLALGGESAHRILSKPGTLARYLRNQQYDVLVLCAGWKGKPNLEDTLFAGALVEQLQDEFIVNEDSALMALRQFQQARPNLLSYVANSSHVRRLQRLGIQKDIAYCLQTDLYDILPVLRGKVLVAL